jgi:competence protein ComEA
VFDDEVLPFKIPVVAQALPDGLRVVDSRGIGYWLEQTDPINLSRRLRLRGERRGEDTGQRGQQEAAAVHAGMVGRMSTKVNQPSRPGTHQLDCAFTWVQMWTRAAQLVPRRSHMSRLVALLIALAFALTSVSPVLAQQPKTAPPAKSDKSGAAMKTEPLDINSASVDELKTIPGIGDAYAKKIVDGRPYKRKDELVQKKVVPQGTYDKIKDQIVAKQK